MEYICKAYDPVATYQIYGDAKKFIGPSYQSSKAMLTFPASTIGGDDKIIDLNDETVRSSISIVNSSLPDLILPQYQNVEGTFKSLVVRVVDDTGDEPVESVNVLFRSFFDDSLSVVRLMDISLLCLNEII